MIGVIDYGMGNLGSVANALAFLKAPARVLKGPDEMVGCRALILPGVGAFGDCLALAAAQHSGCALLLSTTLAHGAAFGGVQVVHPALQAPSGEATQP